MNALYMAVMCSEDTTKICGANGECCETCSFKNPLKILYKNDKGEFVELDTNQQNPIEYAPEGDNPFTCSITFGSDMWQTCPKCGGQGIMAKPPYVPGDVHEWTSSEIVHTCDVCKGQRIISTLTGFPPQP